MEQPQPGTQEEMPDDGGQMEGDGDGQSGQGGQAPNPTPSGGTNPE